MAEERAGGREGDGGEETRAASAGDGEGGAGDDAGCRRGDERDARKRGGVVREIGPRDDGGGGVGRGGRRGEAGCRNDGPDYYTTAYGGEAGGGGEGGNTTAAVNVSHHFTSHHITSHHIFVFISLTTFGFAIGRISRRRKQFLFCW